MGWESGFGLLFDMLLCDNRVVKQLAVNAGTKENYVYFAKIFKCF